MDEPVTRGWWRRNALALGAVLILVPAGVWTLDTLEFGAARNAQRDIAPGLDAAVQDWTFAPPTLEGLDPSEVGAPPGSTPVEVRVRATPGDGDVICSEPVLIDPATGREWWPSYGLEWNRADEDYEFCPSDSAGPFDLTTFILLPADAPDRLIVQFIANGQGDAVPTEVRFAVDR